MVDLVNFIEIRLGKVLTLFRGFLFKLYLYFHGCRVGNNLRCKEFPTIRGILNRNIFIEDGVCFGRNITLEAYPQGKLIIRSGVNLTQDILICCHKEIIIGEHTGIAERVSIRDTDHRFGEKGSMGYPGDNI